jgi:heme-degrading monooxygenase HmoA
MIVSATRSMHPAIEFDAPDVEQFINTSPVMVMSTYQLDPGAAEVWVDVWAPLAALAAGSAGCRSFHLLHDRADLTRFAVLSQWDDMSAFNRFKRKTELTWTERAMAHVFRPVGCCTFDMLDPDLPPAS